MKDVTSILKSASPASTRLYMIAEMSSDGLCKVVDVTTNLENWQNAPFSESCFRVVAMCDIVHPVWMPFTPCEALAFFRKKFYGELGEFVVEKDGETFVYPKAWHEGEKLSCFSE